ncbi:uncharacterized protein LOC114530991 [Dendronephthya gigantea]|uniref:uncharacterized protein LOC114530991 n=1 Tax=Dendronephthya gigantea TaxID=151771 RepID=UPI00106940AB|nr:uncharacterized protein LOC114530991 [Dendronephthya gigantea]
MALNRGYKEWILKVILFCVVLFSLKTLINWPLSLEFRTPFKTRSGRLSHLIAEDGTNDKTVNTWSGTKTLSDEVNKNQSTSTSEKPNKIISVQNSSKIEAKNIYGLDCPGNPHKQTLTYLFNHWIALDNYYNLSSFLCHGSLIGSLRDGDLIPYDRDIDVCITWTNYQKLHVIRSGKPFNYHSSGIFLAVQEDFSNNDVRGRTRVDCKGRIVQRARDPCSFTFPGARLISREIYIDIFVFREHGKHLRDHEYKKKFLKKDIFPLQDCMFMNVQAKCPRNEKPLLLGYYKSDVLTKPHYKCKNKTWVATSKDAKKQWKIWYNKRLEKLMNSQKQLVTT